MTTNTKTSPGMAAAGRRALQWRLLLLWVAALLIPTAMLTVPLWQIFADQLDHTLHAADLAQNMTANALSDLMFSVVYDGGGLSSIGLVAGIFTLLATPFLNGMAVSAARSAEPLGFAALIQGGAAEYWRMFRMVVVSLLPLGIAIGIGSTLMDSAGKYAEHAILRSSADNMCLAAQIVLGLLMILALASVDAGRAQFAISTRKRSALKAWWRGCKLIVKRPLATLGSYIGLSLVGLIVFAVFAMLRIDVPHVSPFGFIIGLVLTQLAAATLAWIRGARLFALTDIAKAQAEQF
jgi:hypothetical protein